MRDGVHPESFDEAGIHKSRYAHGPGARGEDWTQQLGCMKHFAEDLGNGTDVGDQ